MTDYPSIILVFFAGLLSFFSPCVLPLLPSYLSILGSAGGIAISSAEDEQTDKKRYILFATSICFILGFTLVFIILSIIVSTTLLLMGGVSKYINIAAGIIIIILGLNILFDFLTILNFEKCIFKSNKPKGLIGAFFAGTAFGAGWTPCIGPILTSVLFLAGQSGKTVHAVLYLVLYSFGLGLPFLLSALFFDKYLVPAKWFRSKLPIIKRISAVILIIIGVSLITGHFSALNNLFQR